MTRGTVATVAAVLLSAALSSGCATPGPVGEDGDPTERVRRDIRLDPLLSSSRVTVEDRDGVVVIDGSVDSLQDMNIVRDIVLELERDDHEVMNRVVYLGDEGDDFEAGVPDS